MDIQVTYQIGLKNPRKKNGKIPFSSLPSLEDATAESVGTLSEWAGSYHILAMGRHFRSYVIDNEEIPLLGNNSFPYIDRYTSLSKKTPASTVTGNIGQTLTAFYARQFFEAGIRDIVILEQKKQFEVRKTPDFLIQIKSFNEKFHLDPFLGTLEQVPSWWPVECKARKEGDSNINEAKKEAFLQLLSFWGVIQKNHPLYVGYGIIAIFINSITPTLHLIILIPKDVERFSQKIRDYEEEKITLKNNVNNVNEETKRSLKEYSSISKLLDLRGMLYGF
ncbi:MAG: hypothetical protein Q8N94_06345 [Methanoregula sp.]|nr:hypothetical protein [Methanoregula sp.]